MRPTAWVARALALWEEAHDKSSCNAFQFRSYVEQGCLERFLVNNDSRESQLANLESHVVMAPMTLFNSPWGSIVQHLWGGIGKELRATTFDDATRNFSYYQQSKQSKRTRRVNKNRMMPFRNEVVEFDC